MMNFTSCVESRAHQCILYNLLNSSQRNWDRKPNTKEIQKTARATDLDRFMFSPGIHRFHHTFRAHASVTFISLTVYIAGHRVVISLVRANLLPSILLLTGGPTTI